MALTPQQLETLRTIQSKRSSAATTTSQTSTSVTPSSVASTEPMQPNTQGGVRSFLGGVARGFSGAGRTIQGALPRSLTTVPNFGSRTMGQTANEMPRSTDTSFARKAGEFTGEVVPFFVGGGAAQAATKGLPVLARAGIQGATSFGQEVMNRGEVTPSAIAAGAVDATFPIAGKALDLGKTMLKGITGGLTGTGVDVIEAALERPGAAWEAAGKDVTQGIKELSTKIRSGVSQLDKKAGDAYAKAVAEAGVTEIPRDFVVNGVKNRIADLADATIKNGELILKNTPLTAAEEGQLQKVFNVVNEWDDFTPAGINTLARRISRFRRGAQDSASFDRIIDVTKREVRDFVGQVEPKIKDANQAFADKMDLLDEIDNVLRTDTKFSGREGVRKTAESLGRIFNGGKEFTREAIQDLEKELNIDIIGTLAGQQLTENVARSTSRLAGPIETGVNAVAGPVARNLVPLAGAVQKQLIDRVSSIPGITPAVRAGIINTFAEFFREE